MSYTATSSPGGFNASGSSSPLIVTGLTNSTSYTFSVTATNAIGVSSASSASNSVTPSLATTAPGAPSIDSATGGNTQASISFTAPGSNGGSAITSYTITSSPGGLTVSGSASPLIMTGLTNATSYTFSVTATNAIGVGSASAASNSVTPAVPPYVVTTFAGSGSSGYTEGTSTAATFYYPYGLAIDSNGNIFVSQQHHNSIRKITPAGVVTTIVGSTIGTAGSSNGTGTAARFSAPVAITINSAGKLFVAEEGNFLIRKID